MPATSLIPAAQYIRMSTEHQQYSLANQSAAIQNYAEKHGYEILWTYSDEARSGVVLRRRRGLQQLLQDAVAGNQPYRAILVYDVSRWGRFQDSDEAAHYEFLCKTAGIPVHYCAETFQNDNTPMSLIMKAVKRSMAAEYSRELGIKIVDGQRRGALMGFKQGGVAGYGLRRLMTDPDKSPKQCLALGERKNLTSDRVILVPGPAEEVQVVRGIFRMLVLENRAVHGIARILNERGIPYTDNGKWSHYSVESILTHPKYAGYLVFGQRTGRLYTKQVKLPTSQWVVTPRAHEPIIDRQTFLAAQQVIQARTFRRANEELLQALKRLLEVEGKLSHELIRASTITPSPSTYRHRFGSLRQAYSLIGYGTTERFGRIDSRTQTQRIREGLIDHIVEMFSGKISRLKPTNSRLRSRLLLPNGLIVSVVVAKAVHVWKSTVRWRVTPVQRERRHVLLLARLAEGNESFLDFHVFRRMEHRGRFYIDSNAAWLKEGMRIQDLSQLCKTAAAVRRPLDRCA